ncbi:AMP-binding protein [Xanthomonas albilineans]|uniref:AMP-binding protein n=1 Tax=Xanthomonas albilineans TaxID=29447 RepID=UPI003CCE907B
MYTSGSTGVPKGAMNEHRSVVNLALAQIRAFNVEENSRVMQFSSLSFDAFASELFVSLLCGASLYIADRDAVLAGETLTKILNEHQISHVTLPPSVLNNLPEKPALSCLKTLVVAGEALSASIVERWGQGRRLINAYGPTETTVCACMHECDASITGAPPIGRPINNVRTYILDVHGAPVPIGVAGELYIGGDGVCRSDSTDVPHWRSGALACRWHNRVCWTQRLPGQDPWFPHRTGRDRGTSERACGCARVRSGGAGGCDRHGQTAGGVLGWRRRGEVR